MEVGPAKGLAGSASGLWAWHCRRNRGDWTGAAKVCVPSQTGKLATESLTLTPCPASDTSDRTVHCDANRVDYNWSMVVESGACVCSLTTTELVTLLVRFRCAAEFVFGVVSPCTDKHKRVQLYQTHKFASVVFAGRQRRGAKNTKYINCF